MPSTRGAAGPAASKPAPPASTASSSSLSSGRQDRSARANAVQKSATPHSQSSEEMSEPPRRSQRSQQPKKGEVAKEENEVEDELPADGDEEEITRCVCGHQEYPGAPLSEAFNSVDAQSEDAGGLFISCDGCSVWQHGGCVGILEESQVPDKYYCEECKPKLHELHTDTRGQKYSLYQPVYGKPNRKASTSKHGDKAQKERDLARASTDPATGKRRATMRSKEHDDEEEQLRRAIEESKRGLAGSGNGRRNGKRGRDDSDENKHETKRQRRASEAVPLSSKVEDDSEDELATVDPSKGKKARAEAVQSAREAEQREKEQEREKARAEAAGRRQERAGKRRGEDELLEETPNPTVSAKTSPPPSSQPESPQPDGPPEKVSHKKGAGKKAKKLGNNQYTKLRGGTTPSSPPNGKKNQSGNNHGMSSGEEPLANGDSQHKKTNGNGTNKNSPERGTLVKGKFGRGKHKGMNGNGGKHAAEEPAELTMATMKRRMDAMAAFIAKAQTELSGDRTPSNGGGIPRVSIEDVSLGSGGAVQAPTSGQAEDPTNGKKFEEMSAMEMADVVSKSIVDWRTKFALVT